MRWESNEHSGHQGWAAAEFPGDRFSIGYGNGGVWVRHLPPGSGWLPAGQGERETVDSRTAIGWRAMCKCGWRGPLWQRGTDPRRPYGGHNVYAPDPGPAADLPEAIEHKVRAEWEAHLTPPSLTALINAAIKADYAQQRLTDAVYRARADGRSWADIGAAVGISRQSAHERWGKLTAVPAADPHRGQASPRKPRTT